MDMAILYHGTSSCFINDIVSNGLGVVKNTGKYAEIKDILSKYINSDILTDEFFDKYFQFIESGSFSKVDIRQLQAQDGLGPFGVFYNSFWGDTPYYAAPEYAKATTCWGAGEFEFGIINFLNTIEQRIDNLENQDKNSQDYKDFLNLLKNNAKSKYVNPDGTLNFYTEGNYKNDFPILLKINVPDNEIAKWDADDARTKTTIKPEQIESIAFLPPFYYDDFSSFDRFVPDLNFLSKEEFLKELKKRENKRHWNESFEIKDRRGNTKYMFLFPTKDIACVQVFVSGELHHSYFYARKEHLNKGKIAEKFYNNGKVYQCKFLNDSELIARVLFKDNKPNLCEFFYQGNIVDKKRFVIGKDGIYKLLGVHGKGLTKQQMFILEYEKQPQKISDKAKAGYIKAKKAEIKARLQNRIDTLIKDVEFDKKIKTVLNKEYNT